MEERYFKFSKLENFLELSHGISNRSYGDMKFGNLLESEVVKNRQNFLGQLNINLSDVVIPQLAHGSHVSVVTSDQKNLGTFNPDTALLATDALITKDRGVYLMMTAADCLPILIYDPVLKIASIVHAGWRGIIDQIIPKTVERLKMLGSDTKNLVVGIGPGICQKHFIVREDVLSLFSDTYPSATLVRNKDGYVDLKKAALIDLKNMGVVNQNIEIAPICTACQNGIYGSFRKEKHEVPMLAAVIGIK